MKDWGSELWDRFDLVLDFNKKEINDLDSKFSRFLKERGDLEKEYAKSLRKLVTNYTPKEKKEPTTEEETSQNKAFRLLIQETKYISNQHEILAESLSKTLNNDIHKKIKEFNEVTKKCQKEAKKLGEEKEKSDKGLEKAKLKYQRCFFDWEQSEQEYSKAESSTDISRNQIEKLKKTSTSRQRLCEQLKGDYARELIRANEQQKEYFYTSLPTILNNLQNLEISRGNFLKGILKQAVQAEMEIMPIVGKCLEEMDTCIESIDPPADTEIIIYRYKTGNVPPGDTDFEDLHIGLGADKYKTLQKRSRAPQPTENQNLFPKKREWEKKIEAMEAEILKGQKEISALRLMYETYSQNPQFGDANKFQGELEAATFKVQKYESELHTLKSELAQIDSKLDILNNRSTPLDTPKSDRGSPSQSERGSVGYGTISNSSNSSEQDTDSLGEKGRIPEVGSAWEDSSSTWPEDDYQEDFESLPPPPPPTLDLVRALFDFQNEEESSISMRAGEEFHVTETDYKGWTKVQRMDLSEEGFVPTSFLGAIS